MTNNEAIALLERAAERGDAMLEMAEICPCDARAIVRLLKGYEPRVMTLDEVKSNEVVFMEDYTNSEDGVEPIIRPAIIVEAKNGGLLILDSVYWDDGYVFNGEKDYGRTWRCWTAKPTDEQRKAVKWDET